MLTPISDWIERNPESAERIAWWIEYLNGTRQREGGEAVGFIRRVAYRVMPPNWHDLPVAQVPRVKQLMEETGLCLAWVPRAEIVIEILAASRRGEVDRVVLNRAPDILEDVERALEVVTHPRLHDVCVGARRAVDAYADGHGSGAQALCVPLLTELTEGHFESFKRAREELTGEKDLDPRGARAALVQGALGSSIRLSYDLPAGAGFNRHISAHRFDLAQYTPPHAVAAMMLVAGTVRELNEAYQELENGLPHYPTAIAEAVRVRA